MLPPSYPTACKKRALKSKGENPMNEMDVVRMLQETETVLRNFDGQNLLTRQVRSFKDLKSSLPHSPHHKLYSKSSENVLSLCLKLRALP